MQRAHIAESFDTRVRRARVRMSVHDDFIGDAMSPRVINLLVNLAMWIVPAVLIVWADRPRAAATSAPHESGAGTP